MNNSRYYYTENSNDMEKTFYSSQGHFTGGYAIGILAMDIWYPKLPGNVANACTFNYPIKHKLLYFDDPLKLLYGDKSLLNEIIPKAKELEREGVRAIICACGYFGHFQKEISNAVNIPVYTSSLIQIPWIKTGLKSDQKIGLICANKDYMTKELLEKVVVDDVSILEISGMNNKNEFLNIQYNKLGFDNKKLCDEVVTTAVDLVNRNSSIGAILLECSDLPPYSSMVQQAVGLPVFDFITMINWVHNSVCQKPYYGFL